MTPPALAAYRFAMACLLGLGLGAWYEFLRPLRPRHTVLSDGMFLLGCLVAWLQLGFGVCGGDLRLGYMAGLACGGAAWVLLPGRLFRPAIRLFWAGLGRLWGVLTAPGRIFLKKSGRFVKKIFASAKKWVTIEWNNRRRKRRVSGGTDYGADEKSLQQCQAGIPSQPHPDEDRGAGSRRVVYSGTADPGQRHRQK